MNKEKDRKHWLRMYERITNVNPEEQDKARRELEKKQKYEEKQSDTGF